MKTVFEITLVAALVLPAERCGVVTGPDGLRLEIVAPAAKFPRDGPFTFEVTATNAGDARIVWGQGSSSCQLEVFVRVRGREYPFASRACTADYGPQGLPAGGSRTEHLLFEGEYYDGVDRVPLPPGRYEFRGAAGAQARSAPVRVDVVQPGSD